MCKIPSPQSCMTVLVAVALVFVQFSCGGGTGEPTENNNNQTSLPICGDGVVDPGEVCDDGSGNSDLAPNACRTNCRAAHCGDGVVDSGEECDTENLSANSCVGLGYTKGTLRCGQDCLYDVSDCTTCGNGVAEGTDTASVGYETCDGTDLRGQTCITVGQAAGVLRCTQYCGWDISGCVGGGQCGNGVIEPGETCDHGLANSNTEPDACRTDCQPARCGDGVVDTGEGCDDGGTTTDDGCDHQCQVEPGWVCSGNPSDCSQCGNGVCDEASGETVDTCPQDCGAVKVIHTGDRGGCVLRADHTVWCWGQIAGLPPCNFSCGPVEQVSWATLATNIEDISGNHLGVVFADGSARFSNESNNSSRVEDAVAVMGEVSPSICYLKTDNSVWCWNGESGPLQQVVVNAVDISGSWPDRCAVITNGTVRCWTSTNFVAVEVAGLTNVVGISVDGGNKCVVKQNGSAWCWGGNQYGQIGDGTLEDRAAPTQVIGLTDVVDISTRVACTCAVKQDGTVWCWGSNAYGRLGDGTEIDSSVPVQVVGFTDAVKVTSGRYGTCAIKSNGSVWCWGQVWESPGYLVNAYSPVRLERF